MCPKKYKIYFENGDVLVIEGQFNNEEFVKTNKDIAEFIDNYNKQYLISMSKVLYIKEC